MNVNTIDIKRIFNIFVFFREQFAYYQCRRNGFLISQWIAASEHDWRFTSQIDIKYIQQKRFIDLSHSFHNGVFYSEFNTYLKMVEENPLTGQILYLILFFTIQMIIK